MVSAAPYDNIYAFGDSLSDTGNTLLLAKSGLVPGLLAQPLPPYYMGRSSNGPIWIEDLASSLGTGPIAPSLRGGTDFAYAGAETGTTPLHAANPLDLAGPSGQLAQFHIAVPHPSPDALYTLWIGANDLYENFYALAAGRVVDPVASADAAAQNAASFVRAIAAAGAKNLLLVTVPDLGLSPIMTETYPAFAGAASELASYYNRELIGLVGGIAAQDSINLDILDTYSLLDRAVADPGQYGFTNATDPCWTGDFVGQNGTVCADPAHSIFWDHYHPTTAGHAVIAAQALTTLVAVPEPWSGSLFLTGCLLAIGACRRLRSADQRRSAAGPTRQ